MSYIDQLMAANEHPVFITRKHIIVILSAIIAHGLLSVLIVLAASLLFPFTGGLSAVLLLGLIIPLWQLGYVLAQWSNEKYIVTNRRVMKMEGFINKHVADSSLEKVNDVVLDQTWLGRLLNYGNVEIITGSDVGVNLFKMIAKPVEFKREMLNQKEGMGALEGFQAQAHRVLESDAPEKGDIPELIAELDELRKKGVISDTEFEAKKADLLKRM